MAELSILPPFTPFQIPLGIRDERTLALSPSIDRLNQVNIRPLLVNTIDQLSPIRFGDVAYWNDTWTSGVFPGVEPTALPHLAWQYGLLGFQGYDFCATDKDRRGLIKRGITLYRLKGTLAGFKAMARLSGSEILRASTPPSKIFAAPSLTEAERNEFLSAYPELRIYRYRNRASRITGAAFLGENTFLGGGYPYGGSFPAVSTALQRIQPRSFMVRDGVEEELTILDRVRTATNGTAVDFSEIRKQSSRGYCSFVPGHPPYLASSDAASRLYTLRAETAYQAGQDNMRMRLVSPSLEPMEHVYKEIRERSTRGMTSFCEGSSMSHFCFSESDARRRVFRSLHLFDPDIAIRRRGKSTHLSDGTKLGMPHHRADLQVAIHAPCGPRVAWRYCYGFLVAQPRLKFRGTMGALQTAQRIADRVFIDTTTMAVVKARQTTLTGEIFCGQWIRTE